MFLLSEFKGWITELKINLNEIENIKDYSVPDDLIFEEYKNIKLKIQDKKKIKK